MLVVHDIQLASLTSYIPIVLVDYYKDSVGRQDFKTFLGEMREGSDNY